MITGFVDNTWYGLALNQSSVVSGSTFSGNVFAIVGGEGNNTVTQTFTGIVTVCPSNVMGNTVVNNVAP